MFNICYEIIGIYLVYKNKLLPNESYVRPGENADNYIYCVHSAALDGVNDGGWIYPNGTPCTNTTSPIQCANVATDGPTNITLQRVENFTMSAVFKCCLPNDCNNKPTDIIIATIYGKLTQFSDKLHHFN